MDIEEQGNSDGCRVWEVGREGNCVKGLDVAAWITLLFLPALIYTLAAALTWALLTAEERWLGGGVAHTSFLLSNPEKYSSPLQKVQLMLCCHMKKSKYVYADTCTWECGGEWKENVTNWNEIPSYCWDFIASFLSVYFHGERLSLFFLSFQLNIHSWPQGIPIAAFYSVKTDFFFFYMFGVLFFPSWPFWPIFLFSFLMVIFVNKFSLSRNVLWTFSLTDTQIGALTAKIQRCYKHFKLLLTMKSVLKLFHCLKLLYFFSEPS